MNRIHENFVRNLRNQLARRDWNVPKLSEKCGLSVPGLYKIVNGDRWPGPDNIDRIIRALGISEADLFGEPVATKRPTVREALSVINEAFAHFEEPAQQSQLSPETLARLSSLNQAELDRLISLSHYDPAIDRQVKSALSGDRAEKRKKKA